MDKHETGSAILSNEERTRHERRRFLQVAGGSAAAVGGLSLLAACGGDSSPTPSPSPTPTPTSSPTPTPTPTFSQAEIDVLNFALNVAYIEAHFYWQAAVGTAPQGVSFGTTPGAVTGGRQVAFTDAILQQNARELALDCAAHISVLRSFLGAAAIDQPAINIDGGATGAFTKAAQAAGIVAAGATFDPYAGDDNFLLSAFLLTDVVPTAYKGAITTLVYTTLIDAAAGLHGVKSYHAGLLRSTIYAKGASNASLRTNAGLISDARDSLDGTSDLDQGVTNTDATISNIVATDGNGLIYSRTPQQVLNILYLNKAAVTSGGFLPAGANGNVKTSAAN
ncbi:Ferritin-like domain-containing protein [Sphingomonas sp. EC-HK361]|uniref:ferritin-like domain-containing protein n=1 Tax=Sphingomonas sp. EC-HK361 TaxID=2038397 RepID=UPI0012563058|nr:ferritin-like domain-containing protein [Sphingomonas sp. EC-HK361]VVS96332.1 Ferritin-like domain-containing protein [Sphingomonas sp. EC-HK361]